MLLYRSHKKETPGLFRGLPHRANAERGTLLRTPLRQIRKERHMTTLTPPSRNRLAVADTNTHFVGNLRLPNFAPPPPTHPPPPPSTFDFLGAIERRLPPDLHLALLLARRDRIRSPVEACERSHAGDVDLLAPSSPPRPHRAAHRWKRVWLPVFSFLFAFGIRGTGPARAAAALNIAGIFKERTLSWCTVNTKTKSQQITVDNTRCYQLHLSVSIRNIT